MDRHLVVVPHTHWDREWYRPHEEFRQRLVLLLDGLLDLLESDADFRHFTLDGQTIVVDDYLEVRPGARERVARLVAQGRLAVGPWYVLPDEWLVSGEALIRNLRLGLEKAAALGGSMRVGYVPDQFGHVGQLPQIFAGFGFGAAVLWRGVGEDVGRTLFRWEAADGTRLLTVYLMNGYGNAAHLPLEPAALARRLEQVAAGLAPHSPVPSLLLMNGSDHLPPQRGLPAALAAAARLTGVSAEIGTLGDYVERARLEAPADLPHHRGELRSGLRAPLLEGCASARLPQKRADFANDALLTRQLEPLAAWLAALGGAADVETLALAWRVALENHPHDSICGCSVDAVHAEMDVRFARVAQIAGSQLRRVQAELGARVAAPRGAFGAGAGESVVAWNPHAAGRSVADGVLELALPEPARGPARLHLRGEGGRRVPVRVDPVDAPQVLVDYTLPAPVVAQLAQGFPPEFMGLFTREMRVRELRGGLAAEVLLGSERAAGFDLDAAKGALARRLAGAGDRPVRYRALRLPRLRLRCADDLPGCGIRVYRLARGAAGAAGVLGASRSADGGCRIENDAWRIEVAADGRVRWEHRPTGQALDDALRIASEGDRGDEYNFDPVPGDAAVEGPLRVRVRLPRHSEAEVAVAIDAVYRVPAGLASDRSSRARRCVALPVRSLLRLWRGVDRVDLEIEVDNRAKDHRLRAWLRAPFAATGFEVESAFEVAERPIEPAPDAFGAAQPAERPIGATPQRSFATLRGGELALTVASRGCAEVEARQEGSAAALGVTLLRAVGWLSRGDLVLRPGHAGPPLETPGAQVPGLHRAELCLRLHAGADPQRTAEAHSFAVPPALFAGGAERGPLGDGARLFEVDDPELVVTALEPRPDGSVHARLFLASPRGRRVRVRWGVHGASQLAAVDLAGRPDPRRSIRPAPGGWTELDLRGWEIATLRAAPSGSERPRDAG